MDCLGKGEETSPQKKLNKKKIFGIIIVLLCVILFVVLLFLYNNNDECRKIFDKYIFRKEVNAEQLNTIDIETSSDANVFSYSKYIVVLDQNELKLYNKYGKQEHTLEIEISTPIFEVNNNYLCVAEKGGQKIYLIYNKEIVWQKDVEGNISNININKNGYVSVVISGTSYKSIVQTFDSNGNDLFKQYLGETSVIDTDISNDNKYLAIAEINSSGIMVQSNIKVISIEEAQKNASEAIKYTYIADADNLIINIKYNNKNELICMYDSHIDVLKENENTELLNFESENILFADINLTNKFIKIVEKKYNAFNSEIEMQIVNTSTQDITTYKIENTPKKVYVQDKMIAINLGTSVLFINDTGWLVKDYQSNGEEVQKIVFCDNIAGVVCKNEIKIIPL